MNKHEIIVQVGAEGGSVTLLGMRDLDGKWHFMRKTNESTHSALLSEQEKEGISFATSHGWVHTIADGLELLNQYPWHQLYPLRVHPEFQKSIYDAVHELTQTSGRVNMYICDWKIACGIPLD